MSFSRQMLFCTVNTTSVPASCWTAGGIPPLPHVFKWTAWTTSAVAATRPFSCVSQLLWLPLLLSLCRGLTRQAAATTTQPLAASSPPQWDWEGKEKNSWIEVKAV